MWISIFFGVFYIVGVCLLAYSLWCAWRSMQATTWPTTEANLTKLELCTTVNNDDTTYEVQVRYNYTVNHVVYESTRIAFGYSGSMKRSEHDKIFRRLKDSETLFARYHPTNPAMSCLWSGLDRSIPITMAFAIGWLLFVFVFHRVVLEILEIQSRVAQ